MKIFGKFYYEKEDLARLIDKSEPVTDSDISILKISEKYGWVDILIKNNIKST